MSPPAGGGGQSLQQPTYDQLLEMFHSSQNQLKEACQRIQQLENIVSRTSLPINSHSAEEIPPKINENLSQSKRKRTSTSFSESVENVTMDADVIQPKLFKPPPIFVSDVDIKIIKEITDLVGSEHVPVFKNLSNNTLKIQAKDENIYRKVRTFLNEKNVSYFTHQLKSEKPYRVVIRGLHPQTDKAEISAALKDFGHDVREVTNVVIKKKTGTNRNDEKIAVPLPLFFVALEPKENNKNIYDLKALIYQRISVEAPHKKKEVPQCKNCQQFGHTRKYCQKTAKCVKCGDPHKTEECKKPKKTKPKCANCAGNHTASWKGCETYQAAQQKFAPRVVTAQDRIKNKIFETHSGQSYADVAKLHPSQSTKQLNIENSPPPAEQAVPDSTLHSLLQSIHGLLVNMESRLQRLEISSIPHAR